MTGPDPEETTDRRRRTATRHTAREMARRLLIGGDLGDLRARRCGWRLGDERVFKAGPDGRVHSVGVERCAAARICPVCGPAQAAVRAAQVGAGVWRWMTASDDHAAVFVSINASHKASDVLEDVHGQLLDARAAVMASSHRSYKAFRQCFGIADVAWRIEHNVGPNGPHPGLHLVLLTDRWWSARDAQAAEGWLIKRFREELTRVGFTGRLSSSYGVDVRPVDDPAGVGQYLTKWGIGQELVAGADKLGRNGVNVPYSAIPGVLTHELGRRDPFKARQHEPYVRLLVDGWLDYVRLATADSRQWYRGFHKLKDLVPELKGLTRPNEVIAAATEILPAELRPERADDAELEEDTPTGPAGDDEDQGQILEVGGDVWSAALMAWWRSHGATWAWQRRYQRWLDVQAHPILPLDLVVCWVAEDDGLDAAAELIADLAGAAVVPDDRGLTVVWPEPPTSTP